MKLPWSDGYAVDVEENSVSMRVADLLVSNGIRCASTFDRYRVGDVHAVHRSAFSFPQNHNNLAKGDVPSCRHLSGGAGLCPATPHGFCPVCPPASQRLEISSPFDIGPIVIPWVVFLIS